MQPSALEVKEEMAVGPEAVESGRRPTVAVESTGEVRELVVLALKMTAAQLAPFLASVYVAGLVARRGSLPFTSYTLVNSINLTVFLAASSFLQALYFVGGRAIGRRDRSSYEAAMAAGTILALGISVVCVGLSCSIGPILRLLRLDAQIVAMSGLLGFAAAAAIIPSLWMIVYRVHASLNRRAGFVTMVCSIGAVLTCVLATVAVGYCPDLTAARPLAVLLTGAATSWLMLLLGVISLRVFPELRIALGVLRSLGDRLRPAIAFVASIGWPIGAVVLLDSLVSLVSQLLVGRYWLPAAPVHAIVQLLIAMSLVVPLGVAQAAVQGVAVLHAQGKLEARNRVATASIALGLAYGLVGVVVFSLFPVQLGSLLLGGSAYWPERQALLKQVMWWGGVTLGAQGVIIIAAAVLRGLGDTRGPLRQALVGYSVFAIGSQFLLAVVMGHGVLGVWWGLTVGFGGTAVAVTWRCYAKFRLVPGHATTAQRSA